MATADALAATPRDVLDAHVSLFRHAQVRTPALVAGFREMPLCQATGGDLALSLPEEELEAADFTGGMCGQVAKSLFDARTYQVTAEMTGLAWQLTTRGLDAGDGFTVAERELPHPWGFLWLDDPALIALGTADGEVTELQLRALVWGTSRAGYTQAGGEPVEAGPAVTVYAFTDDPSNPACPLAGCWAGRMEFGRTYGQWEPAGRFTATLWRLLDMEIASVQRQLSGDRTLDKQARRSIRHGEINVVSLRRPKHQPSSGEHRHVEWSCAWIVRGHLRRYSQPIKSGPNAGQTMVWIKPYIKGPDGAPLKGGDVMYLLQH